MKKAGNLCKESDQTHWSDVEINTIPAQQLLTADDVITNYKSVSTSEETKGPDEQRKRERDREREKCK